MRIETTPMNGLFDAAYFDLHSTHVDDRFRIFVGLPPGMDPDADVRYPLIVSLDGNASFASTLGTQRMLSMGGEVPPAIVIGVGYPGNNLGEAMSNRNRDYTPTEAGEAEARALGAAPEPGARTFLRFLGEELIPLLEERYPVDADNRTVVGVSLGGLFGVWAMLTAPETFHRYVLASPAIWWREQQFRDWEHDYAASHDDLEATVFLGAGGLEVEKHLRRHALNIAAGSPAMKTVVEAMIRWNDEHGWPEVARLVPELAGILASRGYRGLRLQHRIMPEESHLSAPPALVSRGLRFAFGSWTGGTIQGTAERSAPC